MQRVHDTLGHMGWRVSINESGILFLVTFTDHLVNLITKSASIDLESWRLSLGTLINLWRFRLKLHCGFVSAFRTSKESTESGKYCTSDLLRHTGYISFIKATLCIPFRGPKTHMGLDNKYFYVFVCF